MVTWLGHCTVVVVVRPALTSAEAVMILKVEPGGKIPSSARSKPPGRSTTARTLPVDGWITTMSIGLLVFAEETAADAASWSDISMLVTTFLPGLAGNFMAVT